MRAVTIEGGGRLVVAERDDPVPGDGQVVVRVHGAGLNRADLMQRAGGYPAPPGVPADVPGLEHAGTVVALGPGVDATRVGDRVMGVVGGGAQAEAVVTYASPCTTVPDAVDLVDAGGVPEAFVTAHDALRTIAGLRPGEHVLVNAATSGVGTAAVQLAHALGARVTGTTRNAEKLERIAGLGVDHAVVAPRDLDPEALARAVVDGGGPVDVVIELVGGAYVEADVRALAPRGRVVLVGTLAGTRARLDLLRCMQLRASVTGTVLRPRDVAEKAAATAAFAAEVLPLLATGAVRPVVERVVALDDVTGAYDLLASDGTVGKVVLDCR